jgi:hypothetical protein
MQAKLERLSQHHGKKHNLPSLPKLGLCQRLQHLPHLPNQYQIAMLL